MLPESPDHAEKRGANPSAEVVGYGNTCDAYHMTSPHPEGQGAIKASEVGFEEAEISPEQVAYVNAYGTSTPAIRKGEKKIVAVLGVPVPVSSQPSPYRTLAWCCRAVASSLPLKPCVITMYHRQLEQVSCHRSECRLWTAIG